MVNQGRQSAPFCLYFPLFLVTFFSSFSKAQNLTGVWQGVIYQASGGSATCYPTTISITQNGTGITGARETVPSNSATAFVKTTLGGSFSGGILSLKDLVFTDFENSGTFEWCMIEGDLAFDAASQSLKGKIDGVTPSGQICTQSEIELFRLQVISPLLFCDGPGAKTIEVAGQKVKWYADEAATILKGTGNILNYNIGGPMTFWVTQTTSHCNFESPASPISVDLTDLVFSKIEVQNPGCGAGTAGWIEVAAAGGVAPYQFQINTSQFQNALIFNDLAGGTYTLTVIDGAGCTASDTATLVPPGGLGVIALGSGTACDGTGGSVTATVTGGTFPFDFEWSNGWLFQNQTGLGAGVYSITVTDFLGCSAVAETEVAALGSVVLSPAEDTLFSTGGAVQLNINSNRLLTEIAEIEWSPTDFLNCRDCLDPFAKPDSTAFYEITVIDTAGCEGKTGVWVIVKRPEPELIFLPNIFSPNFDGDNDEWAPRFSANIELVEFAIFDRWGALVFRSENVDDGWDGTWKGRNLDNGAYSFFVKYRANGLPEVKLKSGDLLIAR